MCASLLIEQDVSTMSLLVSIILYSTIAVISAIVGIVLLFSAYLVYVHWKFSHIPSPKRPSFLKGFFLGHLPDLLDLRKRTGRKEPVQKLYQPWSESAGSSTFVVFIIYTPMVVTLNPESIKQVCSSEAVKKHKIPYSYAVEYGGQRFFGYGLLTFPDYKSWKPRRERYNPYFTKREMQKRLIPAANKLVDDIIKRLKPKSDSGSTEFELTNLFNQYTLDTVSRVIFGTDFPTKSREELGLKEAKIDGSLLSLVSLVLIGLQKMLDTAFLFDTLPLKFSKDLPGYKEAARVVREIGRQYVEKRIAAIKNGDETLDDIMTSAIRENGDADKPDLQALIDDFITFYCSSQDIAGAEVIFTFILILQHPQVLERVQEEINEVLGGRDYVNAEDLDKLEYMNQVIYESMRMYCPSVAVMKEAPKRGMKVDGYQVPGSTAISVSQIAMNYLDKYFDNPDQFDPDRFAPDKKKPNPCVYFPFSVGYRNCIGVHFAMMESKIAIARLLQAFKFTIPRDYEIEIEHRVTQRLEGELSCKCSPRK